MLQIYEIKLDVGQPEDVIPGRILDKLHLDERVWTVSGWRPVKKSVDARDKGRIQWVYALRFSLKRTDGKRVDESRLVEQAKAHKVRLEIAAEANYIIPKVHGDAGFRPVVVGFGPCGIFAAYVLAKAGLRPIVLERGRPIEERTYHVDAFWKYGILKENSNVLFGEGGAGTFSDGKLTTGTSDPRKTFVLETFAAAGGGEDILYLGKPHLGTDVLKTVVQRLRKEIISLGGEVRFGQKMVGVGTSPNGCVAKVLIEVIDRETAPNANKKSEHIVEIDAEQVILAIGHSARDTVRELYAHGVTMEQKPFSMGVRIQHPQELINESQYGKDYRQKYSRSPSCAFVLPAAEYKLSCKASDGRGVYTFCMCPGGQVVAASSEPGTICTNGMSERARDGAFANSAVLVDVRPADFGSDHPLAGIDVQRKSEEAAYAFRQELLEAGGVTINRNDGEETHEYTPLQESIREFAGANSLLTKCLPDFVTQGIREALPVFGRRISGFDGEAAQLFGPETRSSSPVRILRDETLQSSIPGLYPCGEGAGYAGGIMSAAVDGIKAAEQILEFAPPVIPATERSEG
ncbi:MAG: NAD(FAD)-utilizing dehydrogenase [Clostridiales Family XIII bacterium]|jgi:uncharacterized FAD-dependent dehydrogenase|nr:NAD(FAD)-utilizing dehydrogenase [Clostridiales Family XIII bacterium]